MPGVQKKNEEETSRHLKQKIWFRQGEGQLPAKQSYSPISRYRYIFSNSILDFKDTISSQINHELETGLSVNLLPVFLGFGILIYFSIPAEPSLLALILTVTVLAVCIWRLATQSFLSLSLTSITMVVTGMLVAQLATLNHQTPMLERQITVDLEGLVLGVDRSRRGALRYLVRPTKLGEIVKQELPKRIRLSSIAKHQAFLPGESIKGLARLQPVSGPVYPNGYDFSFFAWHKGMGGSGFFMGKPSKGTINIAPSLGEKFTIQVNKMRLSVEQRLLNSMPNNTGKIAVALVTGNKTYIPEDIQESLRKTGLAHILAISGLHMALVTLTVIWGIRFLLVNISTIALRYPIKKWSVAAGFISATTYLMLSGAGIATQRAWVMICVMLLAVLMDRRAITMRSVAISAVIILCLNPQSLLSPGFQMSFAAVTALVAGYEAINKRRKLKSDTQFIPIKTNPFAVFSSSIFVYFGGIAVTSLIAGTATAFISAWHFHQVAPLGLLANLIAMPVVSIVIMPFVLFSILLMPYGLEFIPLISVSYGIEWVVGISRWVESISPNGNTGLLKLSAIFLFAIFLITICMFKTKLRYISILPLLALPFAFQNTKIPDVIISENGRAIAIKTEREKLGLLYPRGSKFVQGIWLKAWSGGKAEKLNLNKDQCNRERCIVVLPTSQILHVVYNPDLLQSSCQRSDILIAPRLWWVNCKNRTPSFVLKRYDFERFGTHALYINTVKQNANNEIKKTKSKALAKITVKKALPEASRPWHRHVKHPDDSNLF